MDLGLRGRKALVTGASRGIGAAISESLARAGVNVVLVARNLAQLDGVAERLRRDHGVTVWTEPSDVTDTDDLAALSARHSDVDVLVNNAGAVPAGDLLAVDEVAWRAGWDSKVFAYVNLARLYYPIMARRDRGVILNINGIGSIEHRADFICAGMGNAALDFFTRTLGATSLQDGIRVCAIAPGAVDTERYRLLREQRKDDDRSSMPHTMIAAHDVGDLAAFLASDLASRISGTVTPLDGGRSASRAAVSTGRVSDSIPAPADS